MTLRSELEERGYQVHLLTAMVNEALFPNLINDEKVTVLQKYSANPIWVNISTLWSFHFLPGLQHHYDVCLFSGIYAPVAVRSVSTGSKHYYCHTPPRFVYDLKDYYHRNTKLWLRPALALFRTITEINYQHAMNRMDFIFANSNNVANRLTHFLGLEATVIYPPVNTDKYYWSEPGDYYLSTARLEPYKRVDRIIEAFRQMPEKKLVVTSSGSEESRLHELARGAANIEFTGWCSDQEQIDLLAKCIATIYIPMDEDFGISPVESMAAGKPVIGVAEGGLLETVQHGKTGVLISENPSADNIAQAVQLLNRDEAARMLSACESRAQQFEIHQFFNRIMRLLAT